MGLIIRLSDAMKSEPIVNILGINIGNFRPNDTDAILNGYFGYRDFRLVVTVNPEFILIAGEDEEFFYILNHADLSVADGGGLWFAGIALGRHIHRYPGVELADNLLRTACGKDMRVAVFNWRGGLTGAKELSALLCSKYAGLKLRVYDIDREGRELEWEKVREWQPQIVFAALGAPWQEKFLYRNKDRFSPAKIGIGVGGAFDLLTGRVKRAPKLMRVLCLEWLWRALYHRGKGIEDRKKRLFRIFRSAAVFPVIFIKWRFFLPLFYRPNVACLVYKQINGVYYVFLVERQDEPGHWQIPQGGIGKRRIEEAAAKEIREELGTDKFEMKAVDKEFFKYTFKPDSNYRGGVYAKHAGYKGQKQALAIIEFKGSDKDIKINYWDHSRWKWTKLEETAASVHPLRKERTEMYLDKFKEII